MSSAIRIFISISFVLLLAVTAVAQVVTQPLPGAQSLPPPSGVLPNNPGMPSAPPGQALPGPLTPAMPQAGSAGPSQAPSPPPLPEPAPGKDSPSGVKVEVVAQPIKITVGDPIKYTVRTVYPSSLSITPPSTGENLGDFEILDYKVGEPKKEGSDKKSIAVTYTITTFEVGKFNIPAPIAKVALKSGGEEEARGTEIRIEVAAVAPQNATQIKDIKAPVVPPANWKPVLIAAAVLLILIVSAVLLYRTLKRRAKPIAEPEPIPPHDLAMSRLCDPELIKLMTDEDSRLFYFQLTLILRDYLEGRFDLKAPEMTTSQTLEKLPSIELPELVANIPEDILVRGDLAKFAGESFHSDIRKRDIEKVREFVEATPPPPPPEPEEADSQPEAEGAPQDIEPVPADGPAKDALKELRPKGISEETRRKILRHAIERMKKEKQQETGGPVPEAQLIGASDKEGDRQ